MIDSDSGPRLSSTRKAMGTLPIVAEDLGVITPEVDNLRLNHGIPGMVVLQFEVGEWVLEANRFNRLNVIAQNSSS